MSTLQDQLFEARRNQILDAAVSVNYEKSFQRTTNKQIASRAGVADGTIYNYFKNKDAILMAIVARVTEAEVREMHFTEAKQLDFRQFLAEYVRHRMTEVDTDFAALKVITAETMVNSELAQTINEQVYQPSFRIAEQFFDFLASQGEIPPGDSAVAARLFASPLLGLTLLRLMGDEHVAANWQLYTEALIGMMQTLYAENRIK